MSRLAPQAAIYSPSIVRAAASTAKDWAYVDAWLQKHQHQNKPTPSFERNPQTLEALLALISANEDADEERDRLGRLESAALDEIHEFEQEKQSRRLNPTKNAQQIHGDLLAEDLLEALDAGLTKDGRTALDAMADVSLALSMADATPASLAHRFVSLQGRAHEVDNLLYRVGMLQGHLDDETARVAFFLDELRNGTQFAVPRDVEAAVASHEAALHDAEDTLPGLRRAVESLEKKVGIPPLTVEDVRRDEEVYLDLLARKKDLDAQVKAFAGLPPDVEAARVELEGLRARLRDATEKRDVNFEMLVERESPVKVRTSRRT